MDRSSATHDPQTWWLRGQYESPDVTTASHRNSRQRSSLSVQSTAMRACARRLVRARLTIPSASPPHHPTPLIGCKRRHASTTHVSTSDHLASLSPPPTPLPLHTMEYPSLKSDTPLTPLLITHGLLGSSINWAGICKRPQLCSRRRCIAADLRNHAASPHSAQMRYEDMAVDLIATLDTKRIDRAVGIGHSLGGKAIMAAALLYPDRFSALVVVDMAPFDYNQLGSEWQGVAHVVRALTLVDLSTVQQRTDADAQLRPHIHDASTRGFVLQNLVRSPPGSATTWHWRLNLPVLMERMSYFSTFPLPVTGCELPVLFVKGEKSGFITERQFASMKQYFPRSEMVVIKDSAHWVHADQPQRFVDEVEAWLTKQNV